MLHQLQPGQRQWGMPSFFGCRVSWAIVLGASALFSVTPGFGKPAADSPYAAAVAPPAAPRAGFALYTAKPIDPISDQFNGDASIPLAMELVAPRNGSSSDQIIATDNKPITGLSATVEDFHIKGGAGVISASAFQIRYAEKEGGKNRMDSRFPDSGHGHFFYDDLVDVAPTTNTTLPIWLTVNVPATAAPGEYTGVMSVRTPPGKTIAVPVSLTVNQWKCPDPKDYFSYIGLMESPEAIAMKYNVPLWSDRHFELIETVLKYLGEIGNKEMVVLAAEGTQLGNYQSMIRIVKGDGGGAAVDFSIFDRYLDLYAKTNSPPQALMVYIWEGAFDKARDGKYQPFHVTTVDKAAGAVSSVSLSYDTPDGKAYVQAVMDGVHERVIKRGWKEDCIMYGLSSDAEPSDQTVELFKGIAPYARWVKHSHHTAKAFDGVEVAVQAVVNGGTTYTGPGWSNPRLELLFLRKKREREAGPQSWRYMMEYSIFRTSCRGMGRIGADMWEVVPPGGKGESELDNGHGTHYTPNLMINCSSCAMLAPGPKGPVATARFEMLREDIHDCEAMTIIARALHDDKTKGKLSADLVTRCQDILKRRDSIYGPKFGRSSGDMIDPPQDTPWIELRQTLGNVAAEVEKAISAS